MMSREKKQGWNQVLPKTYMVPAGNVSHMSNTGGIEEVLVPCPKCGKIHKVSAQEAKESEHVTMPCGAVIGSVGVLRRINDAEERAKSLQSRLHKLG
jgi:hypothetical protein